jgi:hypothetical protein
MLLKPIVGLLLGSLLSSRTATAQDSRDCLYNDAHFHIQDFKADGPPLPDVLKMMNAHVCRSVLMGLPATVAHDPLIDRDFAPVYYTQTDAQAVYYNAIQDVLVAHKFLALPEGDRARVDPLMSAILQRPRQRLPKMMRITIRPGRLERSFRSGSLRRCRRSGLSATLDAITDVIGGWGGISVHMITWRSPAGDSAAAR